MAEEIEIAKLGAEWTLRERAGHRGDDWASFVLRRLTRAGSVKRRSSKTCRKVAFYFGHNGRRLSRTADMDVMAQHYPNLYAEVDAAASRYLAECILR